MKSKVLSMLVVGATVATSGQAFAFRKFFEQFTEHYESNKISTQLLADEYSCGVCHVRSGGGGRRTPYGEAFKSVSLGQGKGFPGIEFDDSDADGFVNLEEIYLQTHPGLAESAPQGRIELKLKDETTLVVSASKACAQVNVQAFGFRFDGNVEVLSLNAANEPIELQISGSQGAILARCDSEKLVGSLLR